MRFAQFSVYRAETSQVRQWLTEQVVEGMTILRYRQGLENKGLITQKTLIQHAFAHFLRYRAGTSLLRQWLPGQVLEGMTIQWYPRGSGIKG